MPGDLWLIGVDSTSASCIQHALSEDGLDDSRHHARDMYMTTTQLMAEFDMCFWIRSYSVVLQGRCSGYRLAVLYVRVEE